MILAVAGGKGGVGKSTVALTLGAELDAVVVDADLGMADLPTGHGPDLHDVLAGRAAPLECVTRVGQVDVLPCGRTLAGARGTDPTALVAAVERVAEAHERVVVDCPAGGSADVGLGLFAADATVLVTTPAVSALPDALRTRALADVLDAGVCHTVLNRVGADPPVGRIERAVGAPVTTVPESDAVADACSVGRPVTTMAPDSAAAESFRSVAAAVEGE